MNSSATTEAPVTGRSRNSSRSISGLRLRRGVQRRTGPAATMPTSERARCPGVAPAPAPPLHEAEHERAHPAGDQHRPEGVGRGHGMPGNRGQPAPADDEREHADGDVDEEHPAPAGRHQQPADDRARPPPRSRPPRSRCGRRRGGARAGTWQGSARARSASAAPPRPPGRHGRRPASAGSWPARTPPRPSRRSPPRAGTRARGGSARPAARTAPGRPRTRSCSRSGPRRGRRGPPRGGGSRGRSAGSATLTMNRSRLASTTPAQTISSTSAGGASRGAPATEAGLVKA